MVIRSDLVPLAGLLLAATTYLFTSTALVKTCSNLFVLYRSLNLLKAYFQNNWVSRLSHPRHQQLQQLIS